MYFIVQYECCGILDYTVWQEVRFGRTSLKVPTSCCLPELRNSTRCGRNLLPDHPQANERIYTRVRIRTKNFTLGFLLVQFKKYVCFLAIGMSTRIGSKCELSFDDNGVVWNHFLLITRPYCVILVFSHNYKKVIKFATHTTMSLLIKWSNKRNGA